MCVLAHGTSCSASARSITHGVWPPLTAITKRPRAATAWRASVAINTAAFLATASASASTSTRIGRLLTCFDLLLAAPYRACNRSAHASQAAGEYGISAVASVAVGLRQPPAGLRRVSASAGPHVFGSYS